MCKGLDMPKYTLHNSQLHSFTASQLHSFTASQLHSFFYTPVLSFFLISLCMYKEQNGFSMNLFYYINRYR